MAETKGSSSSNLRQTKIPLRAVTFNVKSNSLRGDNSICKSDIEDVPLLKKRKCSSEMPLKKKRLLKLTNFFPLRNSQNNQNLDVRVPESINAASYLPQESEREGNVKWKYLKDSEIKEKEETESSSLTCQNENIVCESKADFNNSTQCSPEKSLEKQKSKDPEVLLIVEGNKKSEVKEEKENISHTVLNRENENSVRCENQAMANHMSNAIISPGNKQKEEPKSFELISSLKEDELDIFFDDWPLNELPDQEPCVNLDLSIWQRCEVISMYDDLQNRCKVLQLRSSGGGVGTCLLKGVWISSEVDVGAIVSIKASLLSESETTWVINNDAGFLVEYPDVLLSPTTVVGSVSCTRQGVLNYLFLKPDMEEGSKVMVTGSLIHEMLQQILTQGDYSPECCAAILEDVITSARNVRLLYSCKMSIQEARSELLKILPSVQRFCKLYALCEGSNAYENRSFPVEAWRGKINSVLAVEDNYCVPELGLKGKVDVTVMVKGEDTSCVRVMPLEVKTGKAKNSAEHRGQVILYCLMASEVIPDVDGGLLVYLREGFARKVKVGRPEQRDIILLRNRLAHFLVPHKLLVDEEWNKNFVLPRPTTNTRICQWCPHIVTCAAFQRANQVEDKNGSPEESKSKSILHLSPEHISYVTHWTNLLWIEMSENKSRDSMSDLWRVSATKRVKNGRCLNDLLLSRDVTYKGLDSYHHKFISKDASLKLDSFQLCCGDLIVLSTQHRIAVALGYIADLHPNFVTLDLSRDLTQDCTLHDAFYTIDAYEVQGSHRSSLGNLAALLEDRDTACRLRRWVIDGVLPTFSEMPDDSLKLEIGSSLTFNDSQLKVVTKALSAQDYLLVKGLPGCGKSTTVAAIIKLLVTQGCSVLLTAHTHSAVDTVLLKLIQLEVPFLRLGSLSRIHEAVRPWSELQQTSNCSTPQELEDVYKSKFVIAATCMGTRHALFSCRTFDVCIVDESTQVLQPVILGALLRAHKFILVGDPNQLPPPVRSKQASQKGLSKCLFTHLDKPEATICLDLQYRMNRQITLLANDLTYGGQLKCAADSVANSTMQLVPDKIPDSCPSWMSKPLSNKMEDAVVFINVCGTQKEVKDCINVKEAIVVHDLVQALVKAGARFNSIGIMSPYRNQVSYLQNMMKSNAPEVEINTIDQYQGRDKDIIIFSCTNNWNTSSSSDVSSILHDQRRLTVAVTRAKHKLVLVGNASVLQIFPPFQCILKFIGNNNLVEFE